MATLDLVVFPEYALHGLSMDTRAEIMCTLDGPEVAAFAAACRDARRLGLLLDHGAQPARQPLQQPASSSTTPAPSALYYRKLHPWVPVEPWEPGDLGIPVCDGPRGVKLALIICHDGMFPEMAREAAYKGAETDAAHRRLHRADPRTRGSFTNQANAFCNLMETASVCMCGSDGTFDSMGEAMFVNFDGSVVADGSHRPRRRDHHRRSAPRPGARGAGALGRGEQHLPARPPRFRRRCRAARGTARTPTCTTWWPGATGCRGKTSVQVTDGTSCGFARADAPLPARPMKEAAE